MKLPHPTPLSRLHGLGTVCLLAFLAVGCSSTEKSPETRIDPIAEPRLVVRVHAMDEGEIRLIVGREWTRAVKRTGDRGTDVQVAGGPLASIPTVPYASVGIDTTGSGDAIAALIGGALYLVIYPFYALFEAVFTGMGIIGGASPADLELEIVFDPTWKATIEPASGEFVIDLGAQPGAGYVLDTESVRRLGREVVVRDRDLSVAICLPGGR